MSEDNQIIFYLRRKAGPKELKEIVKALRKSGDKYEKLVKDDPRLSEAISKFGSEDEVAPYFRTMNFMYGISSSGKMLEISTSRGTFYPAFTVMGFDGKRMSESEVIKMCKDNAERFKKIGMTVWNSLSETPFFAFGDDGYTIAYNELTETEDYKKAVSHKNWLNFYGPELIEKFGEDKLIEAPAYSVKKLKNGILLANGQSAYSPMNPKETGKDVSKYLEGRK